MIKRFYELGSRDNVHFSEDDEERLYEIVTEVVLMLREHNLTHFEVLEILHTCKLAFLTQKEFDLAQFYKIFYNIKLD